MKPSSRSGLAAACFLFLCAPASAGGTFAGPRGIVRAAHGVRPSPPQSVRAFGSRFAGGRRLGWSTRPFLSNYGPYEPYVPDVVPAPQPLVISLATPEMIFTPAVQPGVLPACTGPRIIELGAPRKSAARQPRIIYGTAPDCAGTGPAAGGPGIYEPN